MYVCVWGNGGGGMGRVNERNGEHSLSNGSQKNKHDDNVLGYFKSWLTELDIFFFPRSKD